VKVIANLWVLLSVCFAAGLWLAAPRPLAADPDCRQFHTIHLECSVGPGQTTQKGTCSCAFCGDSGMSSCSDFVYDECIVEYEEEYETIDMYECVGSGRCNCDGSGSS
jgi:hypothetical protein